MSTLVDTPSYTSNEVLVLQQTDQIEGAATGASYGGIGRSNQQAQQLANRTSYLWGRQNTNITNIGLLQAWQVLFTGSMAASGYLKIPIADTSKGNIVYIIQWGAVVFPTPIAE